MVFRVMEIMIMIIIITQGIMWAIIFLKNQHKVMNMWWMLQAQTSRWRCVLSCFLDHQMWVNRQHNVEKKNTFPRMKLLLLLLIFELWMYPYIWTVQTWCYPISQGQSGQNSDPFAAQIITYETYREVWSFFLWNFIWWGIFFYLGKYLNWFY